MTAWVLAISLSLLTIGLHYEAITLVSRLQDRMSRNRRRRMIQILILLLAAHILEIQLFALGFYAGATCLEIGTLAGTVSGSFADYSYFSAVSYTSVGYGDVFVTDGLRVLAGIEALVGLLMIAWSGAFTVFYMERHWTQNGDS